MKVGRKRGDYGVAPGDPKLLRRIIHLREVKGLTWREIGPMLGLSHQAPYIYYNRWRLGKREKTYKQSRAAYLKKKSYETGS
jgi:hypothetical protein